MGRTKQLWLLLGGNSKGRTSSRRWERDGRSEEKSGRSSPTGSTAQRASAASVGLGAGENKVEHFHRDKVTVAALIYLRQRPNGRTPRGH